MSYYDKSITCSDCRRPFPFSAEDQGLSAELGFVQPIRCRACRSSREITRRQSGGDCAYGTGYRPRGPPRRRESCPRAGG